MLVVQFLDGQYDQRARLFETVEEVEDKPAEIKLIRRVDGLNEEYFLSLIHISSG